MELNIKDSANFVKVARSTIYTKISNGEISRQSNGLIDISELLRVFGSPDTNKKLRYATQQEYTLLARETLNAQENESLKKTILSLETNLSESKKREAWLMEKVDTLTNAMKLLEAPKVQEIEKTKKKGFFSRFF